VNGPQALAPDDAVKGVPGACVTGGVAQIVARGQRVGSVKANSQPLGWRGVVEQPSQLLEGLPQHGALAGSVLQQDGHIRRARAQAGRQRGSDALQTGLCTGIHVGARMEDVTIYAQNVAALQFGEEGLLGALPESIVGRAQVDEVRCMRHDLFQAGFAACSHEGVDLVRSEILGVPAIRVAREHLDRVATDGSPAHQGVRWPPGDRHVRTQYWHGHGTCPSAGLEPF